MMRKFMVLIVAGGLAGPAAADIYKCADSAGHITYSNVSGKGCVRLISGGDTGSGNKAARGAAANPSPASFPRVDGATQRARDDDRRRILEDELQAEQKSLDEAKKALADAEAQPLPEERNVTQRCVPTANGGQSCSAVPGGINRAKLEERTKPQRDKAALHERNIEALKKEIANLK